MRHGSSDVCFESIDSVEAIFVKSHNKSDSCPTLRTETIVDGLRAQPPTGTFSKIATLDATTNANWEDNKNLAFS